MSPQICFHFLIRKQLIQSKGESSVFYEMLPGILTWTTLIGMPILSFVAPVFVAVFIIAFDLYWIHRTVFIVYYSVRAYRNLRQGQTVDWLARCQEIMHPRTYEKSVRTRIATMRENRKALSLLSSGKRHVMRRALRYEKQHLAEVKEIKEGTVLDWREMIHVVFLPTAGEGAEIIMPALESVAQSNFPKEQIIILLATEEREDVNVREEKVRVLKERYGDTFRDFLVTTHTVAAGEMKCKASNARYASKKLMAYLDERAIDYKNVLFSNFDCDSVIHPEYFSALTYAYTTDPKRLQRAYQPLPLYHNNLWDTNAFVRVIVISSSFWHMFQSTRKEMVTFSSHSEPFDTLVKLNFWPVNMISEDSIIYWKGFSYFHSHYHVKPIYLPVSLDAVLAKTYWRTICNQYKQKHRWAYGIENFPVTMRAIVPDKEISFYEKARVAFHMLEGHHSWATAPLILAVLGWLPLIFGGPAFNETNLAHNLPFVTRTLMTIAMSGLIVSATLSFLLLPPLPKRYTRRRYLYMILQWVLVPVIAPTLVSMPAIHAHTRLLFKKYMGSFWVTEKVRKE